MKNMSDCDVVIGVWVKPLPDYMDWYWASSNIWPQRIIEKHPNSVATFKLGDSPGWWGTTGLCVVDNIIEENE
jgi:hypothetical protein